LLERTSATRSEAFIHAVAIGALLAGAAYLVWRIGWTIGPNGLWLSLPLIAAEVHGYITYLGYLFMTWSPETIPAKPPAPGATVDFLIPTYNEPFSVLAPTIAGAVAIKYPHNTYVLDDGKRDWVKQLCRRLGVNYVTRPTNAGAKAGNLNHALSVTHAEYLAVVDADFVPSPDFIDDMLGYFEDAKVAFVQGPQEFYNRDSFQHLKGDEEGWHEQTLFFKTIQLGKNRTNSAFWCGCPSMLRRTALESVGGVASTTVTEDLHTSVKFHAAGWKSVYHPGTVALGVAPNEYDGFVLQRLRWAQGTMQVIRREWKIRGLSWAQRINYVASIGTYFDAMRKAVFLSIVPLVLITDQLPFRAAASVFIPFWVTQYCLCALANNLLGRGNNRFLMTEFFDLLKMFAFIQSTLTLLSGRRVSFRVTPKGGDAIRKPVRLLAPYASLLTLYVVAIGIGAMRVNGDFGFDTANRTAQFGALAWGVFILAFLAAVVDYGYRKVSQRGADRVFTQIAGSYRTEESRKDLPIQISDLTTEGCAFLTSEPPAMNSRISLRAGPGRKVSLKAVVRRVQPRADSYEVGVAIEMSELDKIPVAALVAKSLFVKDNVSPAAEDRVLREKARLTAA
jgi:cellulose synthase (UDP-forming)